ncbi:MAG: 2-oxoacid:acceptor oxidoreductase family protein, partial [Anaerolineales bacterium]|nr:2-oxoacid:acceptor oxidoreductase family protein [Anaerolineales bacterium]
AGIILAEAATIYDGKNAVQSQSYGPEARGGASKSEVIIAQDEIDFPEVIQADLMVALSQEACDKYAARMKPQGLLILDTDQVQSLPERSAVRLPITRLAVEASGRAITANVVALGVLVELSGVVSKEAIAQAVAARAPKGTQEINQRALEAGFMAAQELTTKDAKVHEGE